MLLPCTAAAARPCMQMDTEGSEVHINDLPAPVKADKAAEFSFSVRDPASCGPNCFSVRCVEWMQRSAGHAAQGGVRAQLRGRVAGGWLVDGAAGHLRC